MNIIEINAKTKEVTEREVPDVIEEFIPEIPYEQKIVDLIRQKYTIDEEIAINRQRDTKPEEFQEYFDYCEQCKINAK